MKSIILALTFFSTLAFAANKPVELGLYSAVDVDTKTIISSLELLPNNQVTFKVTTPDFEMPEPGCQGTYTVVENTFTADMKCPLDYLAEVQVIIDITNVTPETVRAPEGVIVDVVIDALGTDSYKFVLKKIETAPKK